MNISTFINELLKLNIKPTQEQLNNLEIYKNLLQEYNQKFNLTAIVSDEDIYLKHFYDCLTITKACDLTKPLKLLDIGSGAGFPGLVLKIFFPNLEVTLLEANTKKVTFLKLIITTLKLTNIECLNKRAEDILDNQRETYDIVTSRAVAHTRILLELAFSYLKVDGLFIPLKANVTNELEESTSTLKVLKGNLLKTIEFDLPIINAKRTILVIKKEEKTPLIYPRSYDKIIKKVLK